MTNTTRPAEEEGGNGMVAALRAARTLLNELAPESGYGFFRPENPHDFTPDSENTEEEHAAHKAACEAYDRGEYVDDSPSGWLSPNVHVTRAPWGPGSYEYRDPAIDAMIAQIDAALAAPGAAAAAPGPHATIRYQRGTPGHENDMPAVVSCNWLPDGDYPVFLVGTPEVDDLAHTVRRLAHALRQAAPSNDLPGKALDYLKRRGLQGSPLRAAQAQGGACRGERCLASQANGHAHSRECIVSAGRNQGWAPTAEELAQAGPSAPGVVPPDAWPSTMALIAAAFEQTGHAQGTPVNKAFVAGSRWTRRQVVDAEDRAAQPGQAVPPSGGTHA